MAALREMLDVITFYKPIGVIAEEGISVGRSLAALAIVFAEFILLSASLGFFLSFLKVIEFSLGSLALPAEAFFCLAVSLPASSLVIFAFSRIFSREGSLRAVVASNYFILASCSLLMLVVTLPLFAFAGIITLPLGAALYLYFLEGLFEKAFSVGSAVSFILLMLYIAFLLAMIGIFTFYLGFFRL
ncbi:Uncharacterised protein [uncultured archaeon]|nr:Uncharacterised protein [uncultured archaeon]